MEQCYPDCANWNKHRHGCDALETRRCRPETCTFHITVEEVNESQEKANKRLRSLPKAQQLEIATKYHKGYMPWSTDNVLDVVMYDHD